MKASTLKRLTLGLTSLLVLVAVPLYAVKVERKTDYTDFDVYYRAATRAKAAQWDQVYNLADGASPFRYAPPLLPLLRPFADLSLPQAKLAWYGLQVLWFALGFFFLHRALRLTRLGRGRAGREPAHALWITCAAILFILRFMLDCFTIGQVSSLLFLGYCAGLYAWMTRRPGATGLALLVPSVFKIGPGFLYSLPAASPKRRERERALGAPLLALALLTAGAAAWVGSLDAFAELWRDWVQIVLNDSVYYDASHYGSQSIKSAILRAVRWGWIGPRAAESLYLATVFAGCLAILGFWAARRPRTPYGRGLFYALGVFPYLWFMPETFKYSLTTLALPVALLLAAPVKTRLTRLSLLFGALVLSVAGLDVVGKTLFFASQRASLPLVATLLLGAAVWQQAARHSRAVLRAGEPALGPWRALPGDGREQDVSWILPVPFQSHTRLRASDLRELLRRTHASFRSGLGGRSFELLLVPFGDRASAHHPVWREAERVASELHAPDAAVRLLPAAALPARGAALREGFLAARGRRILCGNAEQPCDPSFYGQALARLEGGADFVRANRRHPESRFRVPVRHLSLVYGRHRLGLIFNRLVRALLPVRTTDTHSGSWALSRRAATALFALQRSPGFLFDLEASLVAEAFGYRQEDLPVRLFLAHEKSARRIGRETWHILVGLPRLAWRYRRGCYHPQPASQGITADDWGLTPGVNQGILELARLGIVRRVSMMAYGGFLREGARELQATPGVELGLHFDLTYGKTSPGRLLADWLTRGLKAPREREELLAGTRRELERQLGILREAGIRPRYLDGHHHVHLIPGMIEVLAPVLREAGIRQVRLPYDRSLVFAKLPLVALSWLARGRFRRLGFESLPCFYPQARHFKDQGLLRARIGADPRAEVIVHPASVDDLAEHRIPDPYTSGRVTEYQALRMLSVAPPPEARA